VLWPRLFCSDVLFEMWGLDCLRRLRHLSFEAGTNVTRSNRPGRSLVPAP